MESLDGGPELRMYAVLSEDLGLVSGIRVRWLTNTWNFRASDILASLAHT